jgi:hypothetical protein
VAGISDRRIMALYTDENLVECGGKLRG